MKKLIFGYLLIFSTTPLYGQIADYNENELSNYIQSLIGGEREVSVESGRIDLVQGEYAYEIEWANNWKEAIGQCLWYALQSNKEPGIILLMKDKSDYKYFIQLNSALEYSNLTGKIKVSLFPNDFQKLIDQKNKE